ncbi:hypothetical protein [Lishizhenia sp.]|uniref:hypothetical protein n=1 Tax=Lishizhenia sp. TaxID=2497594 RepID=UPI00299D4D61|nr:hypothetical protein [Lishizhenia sp.]MDX1444580.1 hypothetical protein [Lishizhenia sp.]
MNIQELIQTRFSGAINNEAEYIEIIVQAIAVLIFGIVVWRGMAAVHNRKKAKRADNMFSRERYETKWRK